MDVGERPAVSRGRGGKEARYTIKKQVMMEGKGRSVLKAEQKIMVSLRTA